ncbi:MAG: apolipoprotein N-acyltransferase [Campylobacterales bacterium]|nr:apolipoprotein N-acyltransferase [Campylobacterales bacterium]
MRDCIINRLKNQPLYAFVTASSLSLFIYLEHFGISNYLINTLFGIFGIYLWINGERKTQFMIGFLIGIFWLYWVGFSFRFTQMPFLMYLTPLLSGLLYGGIFYVVFYIKNLIYRMFAIWIGFTFITPFGFEWFKPELILLNSYIANDTFRFLSILIAITLFSNLKEKNIWKIAPIPFFLFAINYNPVNLPNADLKIKLTELTIDQNKKWKPQYKSTFVYDGLERIIKGKEEGYDLIVLPETSFPITLNLDKPLLEILKKHSHDISIIVGALKLENKRVYNSTYLFEKGKMTIADKVHLVPFGETIPLPKWLGGWINDLFFEGSNDFETATKPTDFQIGKYKFRNGICYEGTKEEMFQTSPPFMIVTSNNGWFTPSIEPTLQKLLMKHLGNKYGVKVYHSSNMSPSEIIN